MQSQIQQLHQEKELSMRQFKNALWPNLDVTGRLTVTTAESSANAIMLMETVAGKSQLTASKLR
jgi:hypothetical protein